MSAFMGVGWVWQALECSNGSHQKCDSTQEKERQIIFVESLSTLFIPIVIEISSFVDIDDGSLCTPAEN